MSNLSKEQIQSMINENNYLKSELSTLSEDYRQLIMLRGRLKDDISKKNKYICELERKLEKKMSFKEYLVNCLRRVR